MSRIILSQDTTQLPPSWINAEKFNGFGRSVEHNGIRYAVIAKYERRYSSDERNTRALKALFLTCITLGLALLFKNTRKLFTATNEKIRFAANLDTSEVKLVHRRIVRNTQLFLQAQEARASLDDKATIVTVDGQPYVIPSQFRKDVFRNLTIDGVKFTPSSSDHSPEAIERALSGLIQQFKARGISDETIEKSFYLLNQTVAGDLLIAATFLHIASYNDANSVLSPYSDNAIFDFRFTPDNQVQIEVSFEYRSYNSSSSEENKHGYARLEVTLPNEDAILTFGQNEGRQNRVEQTT